MGLNVTNESNSRCANATPYCEPIIATYRIPYSIIVLQRQGLVRAVLCSRLVMHSPASVQLSTCRSASLVNRIMLRQMLQRTHQHACLVHVLDSTVSIVFSCTRWGPVRLNCTVSRASTVSTSTYGVLYNALALRKYHAGDNGPDDRVLSQHDKSSLIPLCLTMGE